MEAYIQTHVSVRVDSTPLIESVCLTVSSDVCFCVFKCVHEKPVISVRYKRLAVLVIYLHELTG